jgi:adenylate cyclase class 2
MKSEIEGKWLNVDVVEFRKKLIEVGAELVEDERLMTRQVFDFPDKRLSKINGWVRLRNESDKITLSYKQLNDRSIDGTKEVTVVVNDYDETVSFLEAVGLVSKSTQETKRESWKIGNTEIEIDTWPWIPSFVEIEAENEMKLRETAELLGFDYEQVLHGSVETAYQAAYNVTEEEIDGWKEIKFMPVPDWLKGKIIK